MKLADFNYYLPPKLIAQDPMKPRDHSRLLILNRLPAGKAGKTGKIEHRHFYEIGNYLKRGDVLVCNQSKVIPAKLSGYKIVAGKKSAKLNLLFLSQKGQSFQFLVKPIKRVRAGTIILVGDKLEATVEKILEDGIADLRFKDSNKVLQFIERYGAVPLPPYISNNKIDRSDYQTVYARPFGSVAAPTAGFHFTAQLMNDLKKQGIKIVFVTLHVGLGTFQPVRSEIIEKHKMHSEWFELNQKTASLLNQAKKNGRRIIACGTTSVRVLESSFRDNQFIAQKGTTDIFIYPGYRFQTIDNLITNFHLPKSTLLMLVSAFAGKDLIKKAYQEAIKKQYRFYSFGDAMLII